MREPHALVGRRVEAAMLDHTNPRILAGHVLSAAFEAPLTPDDAATLGTAALALAPTLPELTATGGGFSWNGRDYPAGRISLRSAGSDSFTIVDTATGSVLGTAERERAYSSLHEGAVYLHMGQQYLRRRRKARRRSSSPS
jgi:DEAD/DEAH box helicase domain-containing protein